MGVLSIAIRELLDASPRLILDDVGIWSRDLGLDVIPWTDIADVQLRAVGATVKFACLTMKNPEP